MLTSGPYYYGPRKKNYQSFKVHRFNYKQGQDRRKTRRPEKKYTADLRKVWQSIVQAVSKSPRRVPDKKKRPLALAQGIPALHDELLLGSIQ